MAKLKKPTRKVQLKTEKDFSARKLHQLRTDFPKLIMKNPNYFNNLTSKKFKPVVSIKSSTKYEDISCVGYNPNQDTVYATVRVKKTSGYGGNLCSKGTYEYVRFYVDWNGDGDWRDMGEDCSTASVNVHDIPGKEKPLNYSVSVKLNSKKKTCKYPYKVKVRAILSWNYKPPANLPSWVPIWGEVQEAWIQIKPRLVFLKDVFDMADLNLKIAEDLKLDLDQPIKIKNLINPPEFEKAYKKAKVPEHRYNFKNMVKAVEMAKKDVSVAIPLSSKHKSAIWPMIKGIEDLYKTKKEVKYEQVDCVGLKYQEETLTAVVTIKKPYGYNGDLCSKGSKEYVAFYADWNDNGYFEDYLGTAELNVHDIPNIPKGGLKYAVTVPANFNKYRRECDKPRVVRIRAILSWQVPPPPHQPNFDPYWGNTSESLIQIRPGKEIPFGEQLPYISTVGNMAVMDIGSNGLANGISVNSGFTATDSPFGGWVTIAGHISNPPNISAGASKLKYKLEYQEFGDTDWTKITNKFQITISEFDGSWSQYHHWQKVDTDGFYDYQEDLEPDIDNVQLFVEGFVLGKWYTGGLTDGKYRIKMTMKNSIGEVESNIVTVRINNTRPTADIDITEFTMGSTTNPATNCGDFAIGGVLKGTFTAHSNFFYQFWLGTSGGSMPNSMNPNFAQYPTHITGVVNDNWSLNTNGAQACGYIAAVTVRDRTIVHSGSVGFYRHASVGFCLME